MNKRSLGQTGLEVAPIGLGTVKIGRNTDVKYPRPFDLPTDDAVDRTPLHPLHQDQVDSSSSVMISASRMCW